MYKQIWSKKSIGDPYICLMALTRAFQTVLGVQLVLQGMGPAFDSGVPEGQGLLVNGECGPTASSPRI